MLISVAVASSASHSLGGRHPAPCRCRYALPLPPPRVLKPLGEPSKPVPHVVRICLVDRLNLSGRSPESVWRAV